MAKIIIIGAGLTGLSAAYHLEKKGFHDYLIFEKEEQPGGLCRSTYQDGFIFDYTGHLLHISDPYFHQFLEEIIGFEQLISINRKSYIFFHGTITKKTNHLPPVGLETFWRRTCTPLFLSFSEKNF